MTARGSFSVMMMLSHIDKNQKKTCLDPSDKERYVGLRAHKVHCDDITTEARKLGPRSLFEAINTMVKLVYMIGTSRINEP